MPNRRIEIIYGYHAVQRVLSQRLHDVLEIYIAQNKKRSTRLDALRHACDGASIPTRSVSPLKLDELTQVKNHRGIVAKCRAGSVQQPLTITGLCAERLHDSSIILMLDGVMDPRNLGACIRVADAVGANAVVLPKNRSARVNATVKKVASGAAETTNIITVTNLARTLRQLREANCWIIGTASDADETIYELAAAFPLVLVMGAEDEGLRKNTRQHCDRLVRIPMYGSVESLNISVAAGVCLYEFRRRQATLGPRDASLGPHGCAAEWTWRRNAG